MKIKDIVLESKTVKVEPTKPRNFVAKNAMKVTSGAGAHRDKKKEQKQGEVKHKAKQFDEEAAGVGIVTKQNATVDVPVGGEYMNVKKLFPKKKKVKEQDVAEYGDTAKGQKMLTKVHKRAVDRMIKADDKRDAKSAKKNQQTANRAWDRFGEKEKYGESIKEDTETQDRETHLVRKLGRLGDRIVQNPKLWAKYSEAIDNNDNDWIISLIQEGTGAAKSEVIKLSQLFGEIGGGLGRLVDFAWAVKEGRWEEDFLKPYLEHKKNNMSERVRDPEDWDEGNTEPPNNFAVYINGKKWKVFQGRGQFADDYKEREHYRQLQNWAQAKSQATGKKWEVYITGEPATR